MEFNIEKFASLAEDGVSALEYPAVAPGLYAPVRYALATGGKRLRPALCLAVYAAVSHNQSVEKAMNKALAVEMFHNFTLLHDDVMDNADVRRGRPTVHRRWGQDAAILSGDAMLTMAYDLICADGADADIMRVFSTTAMEVYQGQQLDMEFEARQDVTVEEYLAMIRLKTSVLLGAACRIGAMCAGASNDVCDKFYAYGVALGMAFQLRDDWLDTFGDPAIFGKAIGGDILNNKKTWLLINALADPEQGVAAILAEDLEDDEKIEQVTRAYRRLDLDRRCAALAQQYAGDAIDAIADVELDHDARDFFVSLAKNAANRDH